MCVVGACDGVSVWDGGVDECGHHPCLAAATGVGDVAWRGGVLRRVRQDEAGFLGQFSDGGLSGGFTGVDVPAWECSSVTVATLHHEDPAAVVWALSVRLL
jgi:hypothetical protein